MKFLQFHDFSPFTTEGFLTPNSFHSTSLATWGSSWASKEAKSIKEFNFLGFSCCFSARIEQSSRMSKIQPNCVILGWFFEFCSILSEKQRLKPRKSNSLSNFASLDAHLDLQIARLVEWNESGVKKPSVMLLSKVKPSYVYSILNIHCHTPLLKI